MQKRGSLSHTRIPESQQSHHCGRPYNAMHAIICCTIAQNMQETGACLTLSSLHPSNSTTKAFVRPYNAMPKLKASLAEMPTTDASKEHSLSGSN
eukprot:1160992-Pelagomonas_calceolata.AAC.3